MPGKITFTLLPETISEGFDKCNNILFFLWG